MAKWGKFEFKEFERFAEAFQKVNDERVIERFIWDFLMEMAERTIKKIKKRIRDENIISSHTLMDNWRVGSVEKHGDGYSIEIFCPVEYASYVEYGFRAHWVPGHWDGNKFIYDPEYKPPPGEPAGMQVGPKNGWVEGRFMMTISMKEIEKELPRYLEKRQMELLNNIMNGRPPRKGG